MTNWSLIRRDAQPRTVSHLPIDVDRARLGQCSRLRRPNFNLGVCPSRRHRDDPSHARRFIFLVSGKDESRQVALIPIDPERDFWHILKMCWRDFPIGRSRGWIGDIGCQFDFGCSGADNDGMSDDAAHVVQSNGRGGLA